MNKLKANTVKVSSAVTQEVSSGEKAAAAMAKTLDSNMAKEIQVSKKDLGTELKEVDQSVKEKQTEQNNAMKEIEKATAADRSDITTEASQMYAAQDKSLEKFNAELEKNAETQSDLMEEAKETNDEVKQDMDEANANSQGLMR